MPDNFFALLNNHTVRRIDLVPAVEDQVRDIFVDQGQAMTEKDPVLFDGNYKVDEDEVLYVEMELSAELEEIANNPMGIHLLDIGVDNIKALIWYEDEVYYFQNFDNRKLLRQKTVLFLANQTYNRLTADAFVLDNYIQAVCREGEFYFISYANANKIFSLQAYYKEATDEELDTFAEHEMVVVEDIDWLRDHANTVIRKQVTLLQKSNLLNEVSPKKIKSGAKKFKIECVFDDDGKIVFPSDMRKCKDLLKFLNEECYEGPLTKRQYATNSKRRINTEDTGE
jgi:hypothetical protein